MWQEKLEVAPGLAERSGSVPVREEWQYGGDMVVRFWDQADEAQPSVPPPPGNHATSGQERRVACTSSPCDSAKCDDSWNLMDDHLCSNRIMYRHWRLVARAKMGGEGRFLDGR